MIIVMFPVFQFGQRGIFYSIDPDVVYVANALSYIKSGTIGYFDHPGTVAVTWLSYSYLPIRFFTKLLVHQNFINWAFNNLSFLFLYSRGFQGILFSIGCFVLSLSTYHITKSYLSQLITIILLLGYLPIYYMAGSISAESSTFLLSSLWIFYFTKYFLSKSIGWLYLIFFISGYMFADRATTFFYLLTPFLIIFISTKSVLLEKVRKSIFGFAFMMTGFFIGVYSLKGQILNMIFRLLFFAKSSQIHGGSKTFFDLNIYLDALKVFIYRDPFATVVFVTVLCLSINSFRKKEKLIGLVGLIVSSGILVFAKLPLAHYQIPNYTLLVFIGSYYFSKINKLGKIFLITILLMYVSSIAKTYYSEITTASKKEVYLEDYIEIHPSKEATLWEWSRSKDFTLLWIRDWSGGVFETELEDSARNYELAPGFIKVRKDLSTNIGLSNFCWDKLYIQNSSLNDFLILNRNLKLKVNPIEGSDNLTLIESNHCIKNN